MLLGSGVRAPPLVFKLGVASVYRIVSGLAVLCANPRSVYWERGWILRVALIRTRWSKYIYMINDIILLWDSMTKQAPQA